LPELSEERVNWVMAAYPVNAGVIATVDMISIE